MEHPKTGSLPPPPKKKDDRNTSHLPCNSGRILVLPLDWKEIQHMAAK
jgi:hypothetical protein